MEEEGVGWMECESQAGRGGGQWGRSSEARKNRQAGKRDEFVSCKRGPLTRPCVCPFLFSPLGQCTNSWNNCMWCQDSGYCKLNNGYACSNYILNSDDCPAASKAAMIAGIVIGCVAFVCIIFLIVWCLRRRRRRLESGLLIVNPQPIYTYQQPLIAGQYVQPMVYYPAPQQQYYGAPQGGYQQQATYAAQPEGQAPSPHNQQQQPQPRAPPQPQQQEQQPGATWQQ